MCNLKNVNIGKKMQYRVLNNIVIQNTFLFCIYIKIFIND